jgi:hypothetical protein
MACQEHECDKCKSHWFDNQTWKRCPHCGTLNSVANWSDEYDDNDNNEEGEEN